METTVQYGIVVRDHASGVVSLPWNLVEQSDADLKAAHALLLAPPWGVDGGYGARVHNDICETIEEALAVRAKGEDAIEDWMAEAWMHRGVERREELFEEFRDEVCTPSMDKLLDDLFQGWIKRQSEADRDLLEGYHAKHGKAMFYWEAIDG